MYNTIFDDLKKDNEHKRGEYMGEIYQAEALDPAVLSGIVEARLSDLIGEAAIEQARAQAEQDREGILGELGKLR